jgi:hypothetical protein
LPSKAQEVFSPRHEVAKQMASRLLTFPLRQDLHAVAPSKLGGLRRSKLRVVEDSRVGQSGHGRCGRKFMALRLDCPP